MLCQSSEETFYCAKEAIAHTFLAEISTQILMLDVPIFLLDPLFCKSSTAHSQEPESVCVADPDNTPNGVAGDNDNFSDREW